MALLGKEVKDSVSKDNYRLVCPLGLRVSMATVVEVSYHSIPLSFTKCSYLLVLLIFLWAGKSHMLHVFN